MVDLTTTWWSSGQALLVLAGIEITILAVYDLLVYVPMFARLLLRKYQFMHRDVISDIPGNVHAFDNAVISLFRTLPEPNNFNLVWTRVPLDDDIVITGVLPPSRMNSITIYNAERAEDVPNSMELTSKSCHIVISKDKQKTNLEIDNKWEYGMVVIRNYLVPPGTMVNTPVIRRGSDGVVLRPSLALPAGAPVLHLRFQSIAKKWWYFLLGNILCWGVNVYLLWYTSLGKVLVDELRISDVLLANLFLTLLGMLLSVGLYKTIFNMGKHRLLTFCHDFCQQELNTFRLCPLDKSAEGSQPSKLHTYYLMCFDIAQGYDLQVTGHIDSTRQAYWSMIVYDEYGLPLPTFVYDQNVNRLKESENKYEYDIRMRNGGLNKDISLTSTKQSIVDVSQCTNGYVLFRLVHPRDNDVQQYSLPKTKLVKITNDHEEKKKL